MSEFINEEKLNSMVDALFDSDSGEDEDELYTLAAAVLGCSKCNMISTCRGVSVCLLADQDKKLYSSDALLPSVKVMENTRRTFSECECQICDMVCSFCADVVPLGYKILEACQSCLSGENNGHYHMFSSPHLKLLYRRDIDEEALENKAMEMHAMQVVDCEHGELPELIDQLILYSANGSFTNDPTNDLFHFEEAARQRSILLDIKSKKSAAELQVARLKDMSERALLFGGVGGGSSRSSGSGSTSGGSTIATESISGFVEMLDTIALFPLKGVSKKDILSYCRNVKESLMSGNDENGSKILIEWSREIAEALGRVLKAYKLSKVDEESGKSEKEEEDINDENGKLFWLTK
jgi:hypothetical protein